MSCVQQPCQACRAALSALLCDYQRYNSSAGLQRGFLKSPRLSVSAQPHVLQLEQFDFRTFFFNPRNVEILNNLNETQQQKNSIQRVIGTKTMYWSRPDLASSRKHAIGQFNVFSHLGAASLFDVGCCLRLTRSNLAKLDCCGGSRRLCHLSFNRKGI